MGIALRSSPSCRWSAWRTPLYRASFLGGVFDRLKPRHRGKRPSRWKILRGAEHRAVRGRCGWPASARRCHLPRQDQERVRRFSMKTASVPSARSRARRLSGSSSSAGHQLRPALPACPGAQVVQRGGGRRIAPSQLLVAPSTAVPSRPRWSGRTVLDDQCAVRRAALQAGVHRDHDGLHDERRSRGRRRNRWWRCSLSMTSWMTVFTAVDQASARRSCWPTSCHANSSGIVECRPSPSALGRRSRSRSCRRPRPWSSPARPGRQRHRHAAARRDGRGRAHVDHGWSSRACSTSAGSAWRAPPSTTAICPRWPKRALSAAMLLAA